MQIRTFLAALLLTAVADAQTTRYVPFQYATIQGAIDACVDGDTVVVSEGNYTPSSPLGISFRGKAITVMGDPLGLCPEVSSNTGRGFRFENGEGAGSILERFKIDGQAPGGIGNDRHGGGLLIVDASPTVRNCFLFSCMAAEGSPGGPGTPIFGPSPGQSGGRGGGAYLENSQAVFEGCDFCACFAGRGGVGGQGAKGQDGTATSPNGRQGQTGAAGGRGGDGGAVYVGNGSSPTFQNCIFDANAGSPGGVGGVGGRGGDGFVGSGLPGVGGRGGIGGDGGPGGRAGGVYIDATSEALIQNCTFNSNVGGQGGLGGLGGSGGQGFPGGSSGATGTDGEDQSVGAVVGPIEVEVVNSILYFNDSMDAQGPTISYSNIRSGYPGVGNISADPVYDSNGYLVLSPSSPCVDAGDPLSTVGSVDFSGLPRVFDHPLISVAGSGPIDMGAKEFHESLAISYGCGPNPPGSLTILMGDPAPGETVTFGLTNPFGNQGAGALPYLLFSVPPPASSCGFQVNGVGMAGNNSPGAVLIDLNNADAIVGAVWSGTGFAPIDAPLPNLSSLIGLSVYCQGLLLGGGTNAVGLSDGIQLVVGP